MYILLSEKLLSNSLKHIEYPKKLKKKTRIYYSSYSNLPSVNIIKYL